MVMVYVGGKAVSWADAEKLFAEAARTQAVEFRDGSGHVFATSVPNSAPIPDWEAAITPEETARRMAGPFLTLAEYRKQTGQQ
ncbi:MAG: hypothetical protein K8U57_17360 [Planctomycetes bacterium]|nr:hypothetical protein [Planctomycetota bacterium]